MHGHFTDSQGLHTDRWSVRQTNRQAGRQTDRQTDRDRQKTHTHRHMLTHASALHKFTTQLLHRDTQTERQTDACLTPLL